MRSWPRKRLHFLQDGSKKASTRPGTLRVPGISTIKMSGPSRELNPGPPPTGARFSSRQGKSGKRDNPKKESYY